MKKSMQCIILAINMVSILTRCGPDIVGDTGGASETVSVIVTDSMFYGRAITVTEDNLVLVNTSVKVSLYEADYLPILSETINNFTFTTVSDTNGEFTFRHRGPGYYTINATDVVTGRSLFIDSVRVRQDERDSVGASFDDGGHVSGTIFAIDTVTLDTVPAFNFNVFVTGTPFQAITDGQGMFILDSIPRGVYAVKAVKLVQDTSWINTDSTINIINQAASTPLSIVPGDSIQNFNMYVTQKQ